MGYDWRGEGLALPASTSPELFLVLFRCLQFNNTYQGSDKVRISKKQRLRDKGPEYMHIVEEIRSSYFLLFTLCFFGFALASFTPSPITSSVSFRLYYLFSFEGEGGWLGEKRSKAKNPSKRKAKKTKSSEKNSRDAREKHRRPKKTAEREWGV